MMRRPIRSVSVVLWTAAILLGAFLSSQPVWAGKSATITSGDMTSIFTAMQGKHWKRVETATYRLISRPCKGERFLIARLRYIYMFSLEKLVQRKRLKYADFRRKLCILQGKLVIQPWHPIGKRSSVGFNEICPADQSGSILRTVQTNVHATQIYSIEYFDMGDPIELSSFAGQNARLGGILNKITINPNLPVAQGENAGVIWYLRLTWKGAFIQFLF